MQSKDQFIEQLQAELETLCCEYTQFLANQSNDIQTAREDVLQDVRDLLWDKLGGTQSAEVVCDIISEFLKTSG